MNGSHRYVSLLFSSRFNVLRNASVTRGCSSEPSGSKGADNDALTEVRTTGYAFTRNGASTSTSGVYWRAGDKRNMIVSRRDDRHFISPMLQAIIIAIEQAKEAGLKQLTVRTDLKLRCTDYNKRFEYWDSVGYTMKGKVLENADLLEKIWNYMQTMKINLVYEPSVKNGVNEVIAALKKELPQRQTFDSTGGLNTVDEIEAATLASTAPSTSSEAIPTVYVGARYEKSLLNNFKYGSYATHWLPETIANLDVRQRPLGRVDRLAIFPVTHFRAQMMGIHAALTEAEERGLNTVRIVTDSLSFLHFYKRGWRKLNGEPVANEYIYEKIKKLLQGKRIFFKGEKLSLTHPVWAKVYDMADQGLRYPIIARDRSEYKMSVEELLEGRNDVYAVEGTDTPRVRMFKRAKGCRLGIVWDRMNGSPLENQAEHNACIDTLEKKDNISLLLAVLQEADKQSWSHIVIRTNMKTMVRSAVGLIESWKRDKWMDTKGRPILEREKWEKIQDISRRVEITWDLMDAVDPEKDEIYLAEKRKRKPRMKKGEKVALDASEESNERTAKDLQETKEKNLQKKEKVKERDDVEEAIVEDPSLLTPIQTGMTEQAKSAQL